MSETNDPLLTLIDAASEMLALKIDTAWLPSIRANLEVSLRLAALVDEFQLPDDHEAAGIFHA